MPTELAAGDNEIKQRLWVLCLICMIKSISLLSIVWNGANDFNRIKRQRVLCVRSLMRLGNSRCRVPAGEKRNQAATARSVERGGGVVSFLAPGQDKCTRIACRFVRSPIHGVLYIAVDFLTVLGYNITNTIRNGEWLCHGKVLILKLL